MVEKGNYEIDTVFGNYIIPVGQISIRFHGSNENIESSRRNSKIKIFFVSGPIREFDQLIQNRIFDENLFCQELYFGESTFLDT